jgi:hypothetical protein
MQISSERIRFLLDQQSDSPAIDAITGNIARAARGNDTRIEVGLSVTIDDVQTILDISNIDYLTFTLKDENDREGASPIPQRSQSTMDLSLDQASWDDGSKQHAVFEYTAEEMRVELGNANEKRFFWSVRVRTVDGKEYTAGVGFLILYKDGVGGVTPSVPAIGSSIIPAGTQYSGAGAYVLNGLTPGLYYSWEKGASDTDLVNGTETLTATGWFLAQGTSVTLHGTASQLITALVRWPRLATLNDVDAKNVGNLRVINAPGVLVGTISPNALVLRLHGVGDNKMPIDKIIDLSTL